MLCPDWVRKRWAGWGQKHCNGVGCRIQTCDFLRVKQTLYR